MRALLEKFETYWHNRDRNLSLDFEIDYEEVGHMRVEVISDKELRCKKDIEKLRDRGFFAELVFAVEIVRVEPEHQGEGHGSGMYREAARQIRKKHKKAYLVAGHCQRGNSSTLDARKVWKSITQEFPSSGDTIFVGK